MSPLDGMIPLSSEATDCSTTNGNKSKSFWLADIDHQGTSPFLQDSSDYVVYRDVKEFGAKGDGTTDDSEAFNAAITGRSQAHHLEVNLD